MSKMKKYFKETDNMVKKVYGLQVLDGTDMCKKHMKIHKNCKGCVSFEGCRKAYEHAFFAGEQPF